MKLSDHAKAIMSIISISQECRKRLALSVSSRWTPETQSTADSLDPENFSESSNIVGTAFGKTGDDGRESMTIESIRSVQSGKRSLYGWLTRIKAIAQAEYLYQPLRWRCRLQLQLVRREWRTPGVIFRLTVDRYDRLGGEAVANEVKALGYARAGYTNIETSDGIVHGQVKQAGKFSFSRIYESGHEVPYCK